MGKQYWRPGNMLYPLPAVMVSCKRQGEKPNIITVAWTGTVCSSPAMVSISVRKERYSYEIIKETGEFVINLATKDLVRALDYCGVRCRVTEVKPLGSHDLFLAEVLSVTIEDRYMNDDGKFELNRSGLITYSHGEYFELGRKAGSFGYSVRKPEKNHKKKNKRK